MLKLVPVSRGEVDPQVASHTFVDANRRLTPWSVACRMTARLELAVKAVVKSKVLWWGSEPEGLKLEIPS